MSKPGNHRAGSTNSSDGPQAVSIETIPDAVVIAEADTHEIVAANDAAGNLFNCQPSELVGMSINDLHPIDTLESSYNYADAFKRGRQDGRVNRLQNGQPVEIETFAGERKPVEVTAKQFSDVDQKYLFSVLREATEQVEREQELKSTTSRLETLLEALPIPVAVLSPDGTVREWNQAAENVFEYDSSEVIGKTFPLFPDNDELHRLRKKVLDDEAINGYQTVYQKRDGSQIDVELYARPLYKDETLCGIIGAAIDITHKQRRHQQLEVLQRTLRHNIRNRLNVVRGHLEVIEDEINDKTRSVNAAMAATDEILSQAATAQQIQAMESDRDITEQSISQLVAVATQDYKQKDKVSIETDVVDIAVQAITGFDTAIEHAIENTIEHTDQPTNITISTDVMPEKIELSIEDDGDGIPKAELQALTAVEETPLEHGSGIGLWAMKWLTEQSGGRFGVKADTTGTIVSMQLPRAGN